jgi:hypothetical protein
VQTSLKYSENAILMWNFESLRNYLHGGKKTEEKTIVLK